MLVIFLDIDGVLNNAQMFEPAPSQSGEKLPIPLDMPCVRELNSLVAETGAKIVISSSWRKFAAYTELGPALQRHGLVGDVIGETPDLANDAEWLDRWRNRHGAPFTYERLERGWEIREYVAAHPEIEGFVILDDCSDMAELRPYLVLTHSVDGLTAENVELAKFILDRSKDGAALLARQHAIGYTVSTAAPAWATPTDA